MKALLIAEKPSLRRTIEAVYKKHRQEIPYEIRFMEQRGHLLTLLLPDEMDAGLKKWQWETLPIEPEMHGGWRYKIINEKKTGNFQTAGERFESIKKALKDEAFDFIINAGDPDQEGELLIRIVLTELEEKLKKKLPIKRFWSNDTTEGKVLEALKSLRDDDTEPMLVNLLSAAYARQHSDYRVGMNVSRAASLKMNSRVACGRVKTPIMAIVCKRELEIINFKPSTVYGIKAAYSEGFSGQLFDAGSKEEEKDENQGLIWFDTKEEAEALLNTLQSPAKVIKYESKKTETLPPKLFKLATIQIAAGKLGYNSAKTLEIIQGLYEKGYVSYPRTDCEYISSNEDLYSLLKSAMSVPELEEYIKTITNGAIKKVRSSKKWVNDKQLQESGHSALIPTTYKPDFSSLTKEQQDIYRLICRQFTAIFLPPLVQRKTMLIADIGGHAFKSTGKTVVDEGYSKIFGTKFTDAVIPQHRAGDIIAVDGFELAEKTSTCPKRFTDADLIAVCEAPHKFLNDQRLKSLGRALKIGTPATRASIIEELIGRDKYLARRKEKKTEYIVPTDDGMHIYERLKDRKICQVDLTGEWEEKLEMIRGGQLSLSDFENDMRSDVRAMVEDIRSMGSTEVRQAAAGQAMGRSTQTARSVRTAAVPGFHIVGVCPECGGSILSGPKGYFCSNFKAKGCGVGCYKLIKGTEESVTDEEFTELLKGRHLQKKITPEGETAEVRYNLKERCIEVVSLS
ncbi:MAG: DNA topoisomerase [Eubacteriales bacterium]|nr:DNA topoisomerase [Eubacteriales bacterium]